MEKMSLGSKAQIVMLGTSWWISLGKWNHMGNPETGSIASAKPKESAGVCS